jgi:hypothetical protein
MPVLPAIFPTLSEMKTATAAAAPLNSLSLDRHSFVYLTNLFSTHPEVDEEALGRCGQGLKGREPFKVVGDWRPNLNMWPRGVES